MIQILHFLGVRASSPALSRPALTRSSLCQNGICSLFIYPVLEPPFVSLCSLEPLAPLADLWISSQPALALAGVVLDQARSAPGHSLCFWFGHGHRLRVHPGPDLGSCPAQPACLTARVDLLRRPPCAPLQYRVFDWGDVMANLSSLVFTVPWSVWFWRSGRRGGDVERQGEQEDEHLMP